MFYFDTKQGAPYSPFLCLYFPCHDHISFIEGLVSLRRYPSYNISKCFLLKKKTDMRQCSAE